MTGDDRTIVFMSMPDEYLAEALRTVLTFEAGVRGLSMGQTLAAMLGESADVESYPAELCQELADMSEERSQRALDAALAFLEQGGK